MSVRVVAEAVRVAEARAVAHWVVWAALMAVEAAQARKAAAARAAAGRAVGETGMAIWTRVATTALAALAAGTLWGRRGWRR